jgi:hypothetical protein
MRSRVPFVLGALLLGLLAWLAQRGATRLAPAFPDVAAAIEGTFPRDGYHHAEPLENSAALRLWGSLAGADAHTGTLTLGPFPAPPRLRFAVTGSPATPGIEIAVEHVPSGTAHRVPFQLDIGGRWNVVDVDLPSAWRGEPVRLVARDRTAITWVGISEPLVGGRGEGLNSLREFATACLIQALLLGLLGLAAFDFIAPRVSVPRHWLPLLAAAVVATLGYTAFWIYFFHAGAGKIFSGALLSIAVILVAVRRTPTVPPHLTRLTWLIACVGAFYVTLLHLYPFSGEFDALAANRFRENLPGDNTLPHNLASALHAGREPRTAAGAYQTSDRPPLQAGWLLLTAPVGHALTFNERTWNGASALWFQLLWVPAAYGLFRTLGLAAARALAWIATLSAAGFFLQNSVFTWPKLGAAAFACGAFGLLLSKTADASPWAATPLRPAPVLLGTLLALGWLAHGGIAFSFLALAPWLLWRALFRGELRHWLAAFAVFLAFALPWSGYQRFYEPPGNLLLKEHFAGVAQHDGRTVWQALRDSYHALPWSEILARKQANLRAQIGGSWRGLFDLSTAGAKARGTDEFFHSARALAWWSLSPLALLLALARRDAREALRAAWRTHAAFLAWPVATVLLWCLLMFHGAHAVIHQGSYAVLFVLFVLASTWFELAGRWSLPVIALLQTLTLASTYAVPNTRIAGSLVGLPALLLATAALISVVVLALRNPTTDSPASS